jgi:hypothetical protein
LIWHVLRDAREEAALVAMALRDGVERGARGDFNDMVGRDGRILTIRDVQVPFRAVPRAFPSGKEVGGGLAAFRSARKRALEAVGDLPPLADNNVYRDGEPFLRDGSVRWAVWKGEGKTLPEPARKLRAELERRTGRELPVAERLPAGEKYDLIWVFAEPGSDTEGLPEKVRRSATEIAAGVSHAVVEMRGRRFVVVSAGVDYSLIKTALTVRGNLYRRADGVK